MRDIQQEAGDLARRFQGVNRAKFAREHHVPGGQAMIYQNINGLKPISLEGAKAYAAGFGCELREISQHWANAVSAPATSAREPEQPYGNIIPFEAANNGLGTLQLQLIEITKGMSEVGLAMLIGRAQEIAIQHPAPQKRNLQN